MNAAPLITPDNPPQSLEPRIQEIGQLLFKKASQSSAKDSFWYKTMMRLSTKDPVVKTQLFRFVDVLPALSTKKQKLEHLLEYIRATKKEWPFQLKLLSAVLHIPGIRSLALSIADRQVRSMAHRFIVGENLKQALPKLLRSRQEKMSFTLDLLGEAVLSEVASQEYLQIYHHLIEELGQVASQWPSVNPIDSSSLGEIPKINLSIKISAFDCRMDPMAYEASLARLCDRVEPLLLAAMKHNIFINFDMEQYALKDLTRELFKRLATKGPLKNYRFLGIVVQAYLTDSLADVHDWVQFAKDRQTPFTIRLVKGAYWDYETIVAQQNGWQIPVYQHKYESDVNYEACTKVLLSAYPHIELALGSHNLRSIAHAMAYAEQLNLPTNAFEVQMLYGMADVFKTALVSQGIRIREYAPIGELIPGLSYLVRRLLENSSNDSFLLQTFMSQKEISDLLKAPQ